MEVDKIKKQAKGVAVSKIALFVMAVLMPGMAVGLAMTFGFAEMVFVYVMLSIIFFAIGLECFVLHIIVTVKYGKYKDGSSDTVFILLIVGFFVPIVGIVALFMVANSKKLSDKDAKTISSESPKGKESDDTCIKLKQLKDLLDSGIITQEEFEKKKNELLADDTP